MKLLRAPVEVLLDIDIPELRKLIRRSRKFIDQALAYINAPVHGPDPEETMAMLDADMALADLEATMVLMEREEKAEREWREAYAAALERVLASMDNYVRRS